MEHNHDKPDYAREDKDEIGFIRREADVELAFPRKVDEEALC